MRMGDVKFRVSVVIEMFPCMRHMPLSHTAFAPKCSPVHCGGKVLVGAIEGDADGFTDACGVVMVEEEEEEGVGGIVGGGAVEDKVEVEEEEEARVGVMLGGCEVIFPIWISTGTCVTEEG